ncbi:hypothetical protein [Brevibacillus centrosporus]|uniref:hypothetical protein n=1 Tax=Brevibacillus centrosporus TaxID=54910 RepID=UPI002E20ECA2|nr:hypothetical protein [Brevibacillus centrosporus]
METTVLAKMVKADNQSKKRVVVLHLDIDIDDEQASVLAELKRNSIALLTFGEQAKPATKVEQKAAIRTINNQQKKIVVTIDIEKDIPEEKWLLINRLSGLEMIELHAQYCEPDEAGVEKGQMKIDEVREGIEYKAHADGTVELTDADRVAKEFEAAQQAAADSELPFTDPESF